MTPEERIVSTPSETNGRAHTTIDFIGAHVRLLRWAKIVGVSVAGLVLAGFGASTYFYHNFAQAADLQETNAKQTVISSDLESVKEDNAANKEHLKAHDETFKELRDDLHQILQNQLDEEKWERSRQ